MAVLCNFRTRRDMLQKGGKPGSQELGQGKDEIESKSVPGKTNLSEDDVAMSEAGVGEMIAMPIRCDGQRQRAVSSTLI